MCNKLIVLCIAIVVVGLSVPAPAAYIGFDRDGNSGVNGLYVDIGGAGASTQKSGWQEWLINQTDWSAVAPISTTFNNPQADLPWEFPTSEIDTYRSPYGGTAPNKGAISRNRSGGFAAVLGTGEYSAGTKGLGMNYIKLTIDDLKPNTNYKIYLWDFEGRDHWSLRSDNQDSKFAAWSTTNPVQWLIANGYGPGGANTSEPNGGYGPIINDSTVLPPRTDSNMPAGLAAQLIGRTEMECPANDDTEYEGGTAYRTVAQCIFSDSEGNITLYGWIDATDWSGSMHIPLNAYFVIPEPATVALLGLGGLALLRRKRA